MKSIVLRVMIFLFSSLLISALCHAQPPEEIIKQAVAKECYKEMGLSTGFNIQIKIKKIGNYNSEDKYYPVYAHVAFWVSGTIMEMEDVDYFKLSTDKAGNWEAKLVRKETKK